MTIHLPDELEQSIRAEVLCGHFASEDALVAEAVRAYLRQREMGRQRRRRMTRSRSPRSGNRSGKSSRRSPPASPRRSGTRFRRQPAEQLDHYLYGTPKRPGTMRPVFADAVYWIALASPRDQWHDEDPGDTCPGAGRDHDHGGGVRRIPVPFQRLWAPRAGGSATRNLEKALPEPGIVSSGRSPISRSLTDTLSTRRRPDKGYSLTDCISMEAMRQEGMSEILTHDAHFTQECFTILL